MESAAAASSVAAAFLDPDRPRARQRLERLLGLLNANHSGEEAEESSVALRIKGAHVLGKLLSHASEEAAQQALASSAAAVTPEGTLLVLLAAFLAKPALGVKLLNEDLEMAQRLQQAFSSYSSSPTAQALAAELINAAASSEEGRACLGSLLEDAPHALQALMASPAPGARVATASAFTKLGLAAKVCGPQVERMPCSLTGRGLLSLTPRSPIPLPPRPSPLPRASCRAC